MTCILLNAGIFDTLKTVVYELWTNELWIMDKYYTVVYNTHHSKIFVIILREKFFSKKSEISETINPFSAVFFMNLVV